MALLYLHYPAVSDLMLAATEAIHLQFRKYSLQIDTCYIVLLVRKGLTLLTTIFEDNVKRKYLPNATMLLAKVMHKLSVISPFSNIVNTLLLPPLGHEPFARSPNAKTLDKLVISISAHES